MESTMVLTEDEALELLAFLMRTYAEMEARRPSWFDDSFLDEDDIRDQVSALLVETGWL